MDEDSTIICKVLSGDISAYAEIVERYQVKVFGFCLNMLKDNYLAEDASQEIFLKVYKALHKFKGDSLFSTWLYRIASNHCKDILRKSAGKKFLSFDFLKAKDTNKVNTAISISPEQAIPIEQSDLITKLFQRLPIKQREIIVLREVSGFSYQEIAKILNCSVDSVKGRLKRAREQLSKEMKNILADSEIESQLEKADETP